MEVEGDFIRTEFSHPFILIPVHLNPHQAPRNEQLRMSRSCASVNTDGAQRSRDEGRNKAHLILPVKTEERVEYQCLFYTLVKFH